MIEVLALQLLGFFNKLNNRLTSLPPEIGNLRNLCYLHLARNELQYLPSELGQISNLSFDNGHCSGSYYGIVLDGNPLLPPLPEVVEQGTPAILSYLRNEALWHIKRLIIGGASFAGIIATAILGIHWRNHRRKGKKRGV